MSEFIDSEEEMILISVERALLSPPAGVSQPRVGPQVLDLLPEASAHPFALSTASGTVYAISWPQLWMTVLLLNL